jgi:hypothetical protein
LSSIAEEFLDTQQLILEWQAIEAALGLYGERWSYVIIDECLEIFAGGESRYDELEAKLRTLWPAEYRSPGWAPPRGQEWKAKPDTWAKLAVRVIQRASFIRAAVPGAWNTLHSLGEKLRIADLARPTCYDSAEPINTYLSDDLKREYADAARRRVELLRSIPADFTKVTPPKPIIAVFLDPPQAILNGRPLSLSLEQAEFAKALVDADGDWLSKANFPNIPRPDRVRKSLPESIGEMIESATSKGCRIPRSRLMA